MGAFAQGCFQEFKSSYASCNLLLAALLKDAFVGSYMWVGAINIPGSKAVKGCMAHKTTV